MFESRVLDAFSRVHPSVPDPDLRAGDRRVGGLGAFVRRARFGAGACCALGYALWTLFEYWLHRVVFHFEPDDGIGARLHWIIHGVHHEHPNDPLRLVMPPAVSIPLGAVVFGLCTWCSANATRPALAAGFFAGYLAYDMLHYYVHHFRPRSRLGRMLRERHMRHHFQDDTQRLRDQRPLLGRGLRHLLRAPKRCDLAKSGSLRSRCLSSARTPVSTLAGRAAERRSSRDTAERKTSRGRHQHQPGRDDREPDRDPELRSLPSGTSVCKLRIACNTRRKNGSTGEWEDKPNYFNVTVWGAQGENAARYLAKGRPVAIDGRLEWREWEAQDGTSARQSISLPTRCSSWARATTPPAEAGSRATGRRRAAMSRSTTATSSPHRSPAASRRRRHSVLVTARNQMADSPPQRPRER